VLLGSVDSAAVLVPVVLLAPVVLVPVPREPELLALAPPVPVRVPPDPLPLHLLSSRLPQVVVESEVRAHLRVRQSFSAAMARSSPLTGKPTYERAPNTK
jgi:hypothetical protein